MKSLATCWVFSHAFLGSTWCADWQHVAKRFPLTLATGQAISCAGHQPAVAIRGRCCISQSAERVRVATSSEKRETAANAACQLFPRQAAKQVPYTFQIGYRRLHHLLHRSLNFPGSQPFSESKTSSGQLTNIALMFANYKNMDLSLIFFRLPYLPCFWRNLIRLSVAKTLSMRLFRTAWHEPGQCLGIW